MCFSGVAAGGPGQGPLHLCASDGTGFKQCREQGCQNGSLPLRVAGVFSMFKGFRCAVWIGSGSSRSVSGTRIRRADVGEHGMDFRWCISERNRGD